MRILAWLRPACLVGASLLMEQPIVAGVTGQTTAPYPEDAIENAPQQVQTETPAAGHLATSAVGELGQRQTADMIGIKPGGRIASRIQNRVQTRIQNRIDKNYTPTIDTTDTFAAAAQQAQNISGN